MSHAATGRTAEQALALGRAVALRADARGRIHTVAGACERILGRRADAVDGEALADTVDAPAWQRIAALWQATPGEDTELEIEADTADGGVRWHARRLADDDFLLFAVDVTSRRQRSASIRRLVNQLPLLIAYVDAELRYRYRNEAHARTFGGDPAASDLTVPDVLGETGFARVEPHIRRALAGEPSGHEEPLPTAAGDAIETRTEYLPDIDGAGVVHGFYVVVHDVTEYRSTIELMRAAHRVTARQDASVESMIAELLALGARHFGMPLGLLAHVSDEHYVIDHRVGTPPHGLVPEGASFPLEATCCRNLVDTDDVLDFHDGPPAGACRAHPGFGDRPPAAYIGVPLFVRGRFYGTASFAADTPRRAPFSAIDRELARLLGGAISGLLARAQYEAQLESANERLLVEASTDALTGVYSRRFLDEILEREVEIAGRHGRELTVAMLDLDRFKPINDEHGHAAGDRVLREIASACREELRQSDVLARYGGEEFVIMLPETSLAVAGHVCERLRARLEALAVHLEDGATVRATASFGVAGLQRGDGPRQLLRRADRALYRAKREGRNRVAGV